MCVVHLGQALGGVGDGFGVSVSMLSISVSNLLSDELVGDVSFLAGCVLPVCCGSIASVVAIGSRLLVSGSMTTHS